MSEVTLDIPPRWQVAVGPIMRFCEEQIRIAEPEALPCSFTIKSSDEGEAIWIPESTLPSKVHFVVNLEMGVLSDGIKQSGDAWKATGEKTFLDTVAEIRRVLGKPSLEL